MKLIDYITEYEDGLFNDFSELVDVADMARIKLFKEYSIQEILKERVRILKQTGSCNSNEDVAIAEVLASEYNEKSTEEYYKEWVNPGASNEDWKKALASRDERTFRDYPESLITSSIICALAEYTNT